MEQNVPSSLDSLVVVLVWAGVYAAAWGSKAPTQAEMDERGRKAKELAERAAKDAATRQR